jgi:hypothetical protein
MIICIVAVGDKYVNLSSSCILKFIKAGHLVKILTDKPEKFICGDVYKYDNKCEY